MIDISHIIAPILDSTIVAGGWENENRIGTILLQSDTEDTDAADETT